VTTHPTHSGGEESTPEANSRRAATQAPMEDQTDPVCGMRVSSSSPHGLVHAHRPYFFCSSGCLERFRASPERYLTDLDEMGAQRSPEPADRPSSHGAASPPGQAAAPVAPTPPGPATIYTCPMHPEVRQSEPGACPICGMALEPLQPTAASGPSPELSDMTRRFWAGAALALPVVILDMDGDIRALNLHHHVSAFVSMWVQFALATPVVLWAGWPLLERGWDSVRRRSLNMFTLIGLGVSASYLYSLVAVLVPGIFP
jgi:P-type Cu+ transporter